jgi:hypothetical protein
MTFNMKGSSFFGKGNQSKSKHTPAKMDIGGIVKGVSGMMGKKDDAPTDYASPVKLTDAEKRANLLKAVPNKEAYDKLSDADKKGFNATGAKVGLPTKPAKYASPAKQEITKMPKKGPERLATSETGRDIQKTDSSELSWNPNASKEVTKKQDEKFRTKAAEKKYMKKAKMPS